VQASTSSACVAALNCTGSSVAGGVLQLVPVGMQAGTLAAGVQRNHPLLHDVALHVTACCSHGPEGPGAGAVPTQMLRAWTVLWSVLQASGCRDPPLLHR
jgi:hypothetical protein